MSEDRDALRAADVDREFVAERLREALNEGRLTLNEYDDRLQETYAARTYGDLKNLLSDLPTVAPSARSQLTPTSTSLPSMTPPIPPPPRGLATQWIAQEWGSLVTLAMILTAIWLFSGAGYYWPVWPLGILTAIKIAQTVNGLATGEPRKRYDRHQRKAIERDQRREDERDQSRAGRDERRSDRPDRDDDH